MASIAGLSIAEFVIWMASTYVLWMLVVLISAAAFLGGKRNPFKLVFTKLGWLAGVGVLLVAGWCVIFLIFMLPVRITTVAGIDGALLCAAVLVGVEW